MSLTCWGVRWYAIDTISQISLRLALVLNFRGETEMLYIVDDISGSYEL